MTDERLEELREQHELLGEWLQDQTIPIEYTIRGKEVVWGKASPDWDLYRCIYRRAKLERWASVCPGYGTQVHDTQALAEAKVREYGGLVVHLVEK